MEIVKYPHPVLKRVCLPLRRVDAELKEMIAAMFPMMYESKGVGLAANQVGLPYRFFVMNPTGKPENKESEFVFINPEITLGGGKPILEEEGCLSFPKIYGEVLRSPKVTIRGYDQNGKSVTHQFVGFAARVVQHEYNHLDGISFFEKVDKENLEVLDAVDKLKVEFTQLQAAGKIPSDEEIEKEIRRLIELRAM